MIEDAEKEARKKARLKQDYIAPWIGFDLDGTIAVYDTFVDNTHIGEPIPATIALLQKFLIEGKIVKIFTARVSHADPRVRLDIINAIEKWCLKHIGRVLPITCIKDFGMVTLYDDRAIQVEKNTGRIIGGE